MILFNYKIENFVSTPTPSDKYIKIFNKNGKLEYTINPNLAYFFYKNNNVIIKVDDEEDIKLTFETSTYASQALSKLNDVKKILIATIKDEDGYYLKIELDNGILDSRYYTSGQTDELFSLSSHTHYLTGLTDVNVSGLSNNEVLAFNGTEWVNSSFTFDLSSWEINYFTSSQTIDILSGYSLTSHTHDNRYFLQDQFSGSSSGYTIDEMTPDGSPKNDAVLDWKAIDEHDNGVGRYFPAALFQHKDTSGHGILDNRYYTKNFLYTTQEIDQILANFSTSSDTASIRLEDLIDVESGATNNQIITFDGNNWRPADISILVGSIYYTSAQTDALLTNYYTNVETDQLLTHYSLSSHTHSQYVQNGDVYTISESNSNFLSGDTSFYTQSEIDTQYNQLSSFTNITLNEILSHKQLSGASNPHFISFDDLILTAHTHDDRYYLSGDTYSIIEINNILNNYFTSGVSDARYVQYGESYSSGETLSLLENYIPLNGSTGITGNLIPKIPGLTLGSSANPWESLYISQNTLYIDNVPVTVDSNGNLIVGGNIIAVLNDVSLSSHTHDNRYYKQDQFSGSSISGFTLDEIDNNIGINDGVLDWSGNTGRYFPASLFNHNSVDGKGILDNRYYTILQLSSGTLDWKYLDRNEIDDYYTKNESDLRFLNVAVLDAYRTSADTDLLLDNKSDINHNHDSRYDNRYYQTGDTYSSTEIDTILNDNYFTSAVTDARYISSLEILDFFTSAETMTILSGYSLTSHTHDNRYYTKIQLDPNPGSYNGVGILDDRYLVKDLIYDKSEIDGMLLNYWTSSETSTFLQDYYTSSETINILSDYSLTSHTHELENLSGVTITLPSNDDVLVYDNGVWINKAFAMNDYYTKIELDGGQLDTRYYTKTEIDNNIYTKTEIDLNYFTSADTIDILSGYSLTSHTHDNQYYTMDQFSGSSSGYTIDEMTPAGSLKNDAVLDWKAIDEYDNDGGRYFPAALFQHYDSYGHGILDNRYCTRICIDEKFNAVMSGITGLTLSGDSVLYTNYTPVPEDLGGVETGDTFPSGTTIQDVLDQLLYPYQSPSFNSFTNGMGGIMEIGTVIPGSIHTHKWITNVSDNILPNTIEISGDNLTTVVGLNNNSANSGETDIWISGFTGIGNYSWNIKATNTNGDTLTKNINMSFQHKRYWGKTTNNLTSFSSLTDAEKGTILQGLTGADAGSGSDFSSIKRSYNGINGATEYLIFGYVITSPYEVQFKINGLPNTAWNYTDFQYNNSQGHTETYRVYISDTAQNSPIALFEIF